MNLDGSSLVERSFADLMAQIPDLRGFWSEQSCWKPVRTVETLLRYASHSLVSLTLTGPFVGSYNNHHSDVYIGSLRGFKTLTTLRIDVPMLIDNAADVLCSNESTTSSSEETESEGDENGLESTWYLDAAEKVQIVHSLINTLPSSTESLTLEMLASKTVMQQLLSRMPDRKTERLPNLHTIVYQCEERCVTGMEDECEAVGVRLVQTLKFGKFKNWRRDSLESEGPDYNLTPDDWGYYDSYDYDYHSSGYEYINHRSYYFDSPQYFIGLAEDEEESLREWERTHSGDGELTQVYRDIEDFEWRISQAETLTEEREEEVGPTEGHLFEPRGYSSEIVKTGDVERDG